MVVLPVDLLYDRKEKSEPPVQDCCSLRVKERCLEYCNFPANFLQFSRNFSQLDLIPPQTPIFLQLFAICFPGLSL